MKRTKNYYWLMLIFSLICIYLLAPDLDRRHGILVSTAFAAILIFNSGLVASGRFFWRCLLFIAIDVLTYFILFNEQPWDFLFHAGLYDSSVAPLVFCSLIMSLAGGLLLRTWPDRLKYFCVTSGLQIPLAFFVGTPAVEAWLNRLAALLGFYPNYSGVWQAWQFEWMLTYYLPIYFLNYKYVLKNNPGGENE